LSLLLFSARRMKMQLEKQRQQLKI